MKKSAKFRTTELSDPAFEMDNLRFITVKTPSLNGRGDICIFVPPGDGSQDLPIVTLLHGVYGSAWVWPFLGNAHNITKALINQNKIKPVILAMPSDGLWGDGSGYMPHSGYDFERWIAEDVPLAVRENIPQSSAKSKLFIAGLSMGGFGALKIGSMYGMQYAGISAHSSITNVAQMKMFVEEPLAAYEQIPETGNVLTSILQHKDQLPPMRFDCGIDDELIEYNRILHKQLDDHSIAHIYEEFPGSHQWKYWQEHLVDTLVFFDSLAS
jgi:putative tributyrin esterase